MLLAVLRDPSLLTVLPVEDRDLLLGEARRARLLPRLDLAVQDAAIADQLPDKLVDHLRAARVLAEHNARRVRWEANRIAHALSSLDSPIILLKGAAYVLAELPVARGRLASDIDIMVPEEALDTVQSALEASGWEPMTLDPYDQQYYRRWMHELPPLRHRDRGTIVDVHHTILPRTSRLRPDPQKLWAEARSLPEPPYSILSPEDMALHSAAHLFHDGDLRVAIRDLLDIHELLTHFGKTPSFWERLVPRARQMNLVRPLLYALRYSAWLFETRIPTTVSQDIVADAPNRFVLGLMDRLAPQVLLPPHPYRVKRSTGQAAMALYIRSHWLRMPPMLLAAHLARKSIRRVAWQGEKDD